VLLLPAGSRCKYHTTSEGCPEVVGARDRGTLRQFGCAIAVIRPFLVDCTRILDEIVIDPLESLSEVPSPNRNPNKTIQAVREEIDEDRIASMS
jgi:hypothetical protein